MRLRFFERPRAEVTMQAFAVVVRPVELDRTGRRSQVISVKVSQPAQLGSDVAIHCVIGVEIAGVSAARQKTITRLIFRVRISCSLLKQWSEGSLGYVRSEE